MAPAAWTLSQSYEQTATLRVVGGQQAKELRMLATLQARREVLEQAAEYLAAQPATAKLTQSDRMALAAIHFQITVIELSGEAPEQSVKAKILADTSLMPENITEYLNGHHLTLQSVQRNLDRAATLEKDFDSYLKTLSQTRSPIKSDALRTSTGMVLQNRYQSMVLFQQGMNSMRRSRDQEARNLFSQAIALDPTYEQAVMMRGISALRAKDYDPAIKDFEMAMELHADDDELLLLLHATALTEQGARPQQAIMDLTKILQINPRMARAYMLRAQNYTQLLRCTEATLDLKRACELGITEACDTDCRNNRRRRWR